MNVDQKKLERQLLCVDRYIANKGIGCLELTTAFGKTYCAVLIAKRLVVKPGNKNRSIIVVVPTIQLKEQWEVTLKYNKIKNFKVHVINTVVLSKVNLTCDLLILDEIHRLGSKEFIKVFELVTYKFILGLTATLHRLDEKHLILKEKCPVVDTITQEEAKREGYISDFIEFNLGIILNDVDRSIYAKLNGEFHKCFAVFGHDFPTAIKCMSKKGSEEYAALYGLDAKQVGFQANRWNKLMRDRKEYLYKANSKVEMCKQIFEAFKDYKTVTFSEAVDFTDILTNHLGSEAVSYHSKMGIKARREAIKKFTDNRYKIRVINTARALDQGFNVEDLELGIICSSTTNPVQQTQRKGRLLRKHTYKDGTEKVPIVINLYIKDSQDERWLHQRQTDPITKLPTNPDVIWTDRLDQVVRLSNI